MGVFQTVAGEADGGEAPIKLSLVEEDGATVLLVVAMVNLSGGPDPAELAEWIISKHFQSQLLPVVRLKILAVEGEPLATGERVI